MQATGVLNCLHLQPDEIARRFAMAEAQGQSLWLWREVEVPAWQAALAKIEGIAREIVLNGATQIALDGDIQTTSLALYTSGTGPLLGHWLTEGRIQASEPMASLLRHHLHHNSLRARKMADAACSIARQFSSRQIGTTVLKGMHTGHAYFPDPAVRPLSDIDLLVQPHDAQIAGAILAEMGFEQRGRPAFNGTTWTKRGQSGLPRTLFYVHADDPWSVDLHVTLNRQTLANERPICLDMVAGTQGEPWPLVAQVRCLGQPALLLNLAIHAGTPLISLTLIRLIELALVIREDSANGKLSWDGFLAEGDRVGVLDRAFTAFHFLNRFFPGTVPDAVLAACRERVTARARVFIEDLTLAEAPGLDRSSISERYMWLPSRRAIVRQLAADLLPLQRGLMDSLRIYRTLVRRILHGVLVR